MSHLLQYHHITPTTPLLQAPQAQQSTTISQKHHQILQNHHSTCPRLLSTLPVSSQGIQPRTRETISHNHLSSPREIHTHTFSSPPHHPDTQPTPIRHLQATSGDIIYSIPILNNAQTRNQPTTSINHQCHSLTPTATSVDTCHTDPRLDPSSATYPSQHAAP